MPLNYQFLPDPPIVREAIVSEEAKRRVDDEGTEADDESEIISVGGPLSIVGGCGDTAGLPICYISSFSVTINFLLGF